MVVDGSERVKIDEREITRSDSAGMSNYTLDTFSGILTFRDGLIVPSTSTITVSFETQSYNSTPGAIWGLRTDVPFSKTSGMGFTYLAQSSGQKPVQYGRITEPFSGNNSMSLPYELLYVPMKSDPPVVKVDGLQQIENVDYAVNYPLKYILFSRTITSSSTVLVTYTPQPENAVQGDRGVMGLDGKVRLSNNLTLTGQVARSSSAYSGGNGGGAASIRAAGAFGRLTATADIRSISTAFAPIESAGFFRNERGGDLDVRYKFSDSLNWFSRIDRFSRPDYRTADPTAARMLKSTQLMNGFEWKHKKLPQLKLSRTTMNNDNGLDYRDSLTTDAVTVDWSIGKVAATGEINRSNRFGTYMGSNNKLTSTNNSSNTSRLSLRYTPGTWFSLSGDVAGSKIRGSGATSTDAKNYQLTARFNPTSTVSIDTSYRVADSGGNYSSAYPIGNGGMVDSGLGAGVGYPGLGYVNSYGLKSVTRMISLNWNPSSRFSFDTSYNYSLSDGVNSTNTSINGLNLGFTVNPLDILTFRGNLSRQNGNFVGAGGDMSSRIGFMSMTVGPLKNFNLDLNYQKMLSSSQQADVVSPENSRVDLQSLSAVLRRAIGGGRSVFTEYSYSSTSGVVTNNKGALALGVEYPLTDILGLKLDWRIINYTDARNSAYNYRANMLNAQIGARFR
jgi:hypothetical protein